jgi:ribosomal protein S18 acetylase RimI-like enzyme
VRAARPEDAGAVAALWTEAYVTLGGGGRVAPYTGADLLETAARGEVFVAERGDAIVGVVALLPPGAPGRAVAEAGEAELCRLAVGVTARGTGIGRALAVLCEERARAAGWQAIALWSRPYQHEAHRLYESLGYRRAPERDTVDETGHGRLVFRLALGGGKV